MYGIGVKTSRIIKHKECNQCNGIRGLPSRIWEVISSKTNFNKLNKSKNYKNSNIIVNNIALGSDESELEFFQTSDSSSSTFCKIDYDSNYFKRKISY